MIRALLHWMIRRFEAQNDYDAAYLHDIAHAWPGAALKVQGLGRLSGLVGPEPDLWAGAVLASTLDGDCGPCTQLVAQFGLAAGVDPDRIAACLARDFDRAGAVGLGFRFAEAAIADAPELDALRAQITSAHGPRALIAATCAAATGRAYPVLKRGMGHGKDCRQIVLGGVAHPVVRQRA